MVKKASLKKNLKSKVRRYFFLFSMVVICMTTYLVIDFVGEKIGKKLIGYAEVEVARIARYVVNYAVTTENIKELEFDNLFIVTKNKNDEIQTVDFDPVVVNTVLNAITETVLKYFKAIEQGDLDTINISNNYLINTNMDKLKQGIIAEIPMGVITNNALLANLGPKLPVKLSLAGEIESNIETEIKYYGINNALITIYANISVSQQIYMPIAVGRVVINQKIPIAIKMMQGVVPNYYFDNLSSNSIISDIVK